MILAGIDQTDVIADVVGHIGVGFDAHDAAVLVLDRGMDQFDQLLRFAAPKQSSAMPIAAAGSGSHVAAHRHTAHARPRSTCETSVEAPAAVSAASTSFAVRLPRSARRNTAHASAADSHFAHQSGSSRACPNRLTPPNTAQTAAVSAG